MKTAQQILDVYTYDELSEQAKTIALKNYAAEEIEQNLLTNPSLEDGVRIVADELKNFKDRSLSQAVENICSQVSSILSKEVLEEYIRNNDYFFNSAGEMVEASAHKIHY